MVSDAATGLVVSRVFSAAPNEVFAAWIDPVIAAKWLFRTPEGLTVQAETDPQEGGEFIFVEDRPDERIVHVGEYLKVESPHLLAFVFSLDQFRATNEVEVRFEEADGGTKLTLTHKLDPRWLSFSERTAKSWNEMLDVLQRLLSNEH